MAYRRKSDVKDTAYYKQTGLWAKSPDSYQIQVREDILSLIPPDVETVLDAGCGDGLITNALPDNLKVVGIDISEAALEHVRRETLVGSATAIPFKEKSFDLVMANDVLEHLPKEEYENSLNELVRIAKHYILITVPYAEQLEASETKCIKCGAVYHVNWHQRSFDTSQLLSLLPAPFQPVELRFSGSCTRPPFDPTAAARQELGQFRHWDDAICPRCGSKEQVHAEDDSPLSSIMDAYRSSLWSSRTCHNNRSEIIALYSRESFKHTTPIKEYQEDMRSLLDIDFLNPLQRVHGDFAPGRLWGCYWLSPEAVQTEHGVRESPIAAQPAIVSVRQPIKPEVGDIITLRTFAAKAGGNLKLFATDSLLNKQQLLLNTHVPSGESTFDVRVEDSWWPDRFGTPLAIYLTGEASIVHMRYQTRSRLMHTVPFVLMEPGHNVIRVQREGTCLSWGLDVDSGGYIPKPLLDLENESAEEKDVAAHVWEDLAENVNKGLTLLHCENKELKTHLDSMEKDRVRAEDSYSKLGNQYNELNRITQEKALEAERLHERHMQLQVIHSRLEQQHSQLEHKHGQLDQQNEELRLAEKAAKTEAGHLRLQKTKAQRDLELQKLLNEIHTLRRELPIRMQITEGVKRVLRYVKRRMVGIRVPAIREGYPDPWHLLTNPVKLAKGSPKVLILSHMFPHPDQPGSGIFIQEQVKALRQLEGIDARVLVGRPFWTTSHGKHPFTIFRMNNRYRTMHDASRWMEFQGVPVKYLPYRVFHGFWARGWMYRSSFCRNIAEIYKEFPFEMIHAHTAYLDGSAGRALAEKYNVPLIITEHTGPFSMLTSNRIVKSYTTKALEHAAKVIAVSTAQENNICLHMPEELRQKTMVIPNGVDQKLFYPSEKWKPQVTRPHFLFVGFFSDIKNLPVLLEAFSRVLSHIPKAQLTLAGGGETKQDEIDLMDWIRRLGIENNVKVIGHQVREDVSWLMREMCDVFVLASKAETFGCVLIEAMASGKPVVVTRCGGPEDIVADSMLGEMCPPNDPDALAETMLDVAKRLPEYDSGAIRDFTVRNFSFESIAQRLANVYDEVLTDARKISDQTSTVSTGEKAIHESPL